MSDKVVVDLDVSMGFPVHLVLLAHLDAIHQTQEGGAVKFLELGIGPYQVRSTIGGAFVLLVSLQLRYKLRLLFQNAVPRFQDLRLLTFLPRQFSILISSFMKNMCSILIAQAGVPVNTCREILTRAGRNDGRVLS